MLLNIKCKNHLVKSLLINDTDGSFDTSRKGWMIQPVMSVYYTWMMIVVTFYYVVVSCGFCTHNEVV